jgi:hypothetical protein
MRVIVTVFDGLHDEHQRGVGRTPRRPLTAHVAHAHDHELTFRNDPRILSPAPAAR